jgi:toxin YoeB
MFKHETTRQFDREYEKFYRYNKHTAEKIDELMADTLEHPTYGLGHPERLRHRSGNWWSRHINKKNRLVYRIIGNVIRFECCQGHYDDH